MLFLIFLLYNNNNKYKYQTTFHGGISMKTLVTGLPAMSNIKPIEWLWEPLIPKNCISVLASRGGMGKSGFALWISAELGKSGYKILYLDAERTGFHIKQRVEDWNLDISNITFYLDSCEDGSTSTCAPGTLVEMAKIVEESKPDLVIIDSLTALSNGMDLNRREVVAHYMKELTRMASTNHTGILILAHNNKKTSDDIPLLDSIAGSGAITDLARSAMVIDEFGTDGSRIITQVKINLAAKSEPLIFKITSTGIEDVRFLSESSRESGTKAEKYRNIALQLIQKGNNKKDVREVLKSEGASPAEYGRAIDWAANKLGIKWDNITIQPEA